jgi:hypothetical protein
MPEVQKIVRALPVRSVSTTRRHNQQPRDRRHRLVSSWTNMDKGFRDIIFNSRLKFRCLPIWHNVDNLRDYELSFVNKSYRYW